MSEKHQAAGRLLQAAQEMQALLTEEADGTHLCNMIRAVACNASCIRLLTQLQTRDSEDDEDETDEGMFDAEEDPDS